MTLSPASEGTEIVAEDLSKEMLDPYPGLYCVESFHPLVLRCSRRNRPDFIAYNYRWADQWGYRICRRMFGVVNTAWTIRSEKAMKRAKRFFDIFIFDSFKP